MVWLLGTEKEEVPKSGVDLAFHLIVGGRVNGSCKVLLGKGLCNWTLGVRRDGVSDSVDLWKQAIRRIE